MQLQVDRMRLLLVGKWASGHTDMIAGACLRGRWPLFLIGGPEASLLGPPPRHTRADAVFWQEEDERYCKSNHVERSK